MTEIHKIKIKKPGQKSKKLIQLESLLKKVKEKIIREFDKSINKQWTEKLKSIHPYDPVKCLPEINRLFRKKGLTPIDTLKIPEGKIKIMENANLNPAEFRKDNINNIIIIKPRDKLDIIGSHFELANNQNENLGKPLLKSIVNTKIEEFKAELDSDK